MSKKPDYKKLFQLVDSAIDDAFKVFFSAFARPVKAYARSVYYREKYIIYAKCLEDVINVLIAAQQECEEIYLDSTE